MIDRQRAISHEEKAQKRDEILDAAEALWLENHNEIASMNQVATAAGVAKGTLYLYFSSKEVLFLSLHERQTLTFFDMVISRANQPEPMQVEDMYKVVRQFIESRPAFLPLATLVHGLMERQIPPETSFQFKERILTRLNTAVDSLKPHFPDITQHLMMQSYAMIIGLWQLLRPTPLRDLIIERMEGMACADSYLDALGTALNALWHGNLMQEKSL